MHIWCSSGCVTMCTACTYHHLHAYDMHAHDAIDSISCTCVPACLQASQLSDQLVDALLAAGMPSAAVEVLREASAARARVFGRVTVSAQTELRLAQARAVMNHMHFRCLVTFDCAMMSAFKQPAVKAGVTLHACLDVAVKLHDLSLYHSACTFDVLWVVSQGHLLYQTCMACMHARDPMNREG